MTTRRKAGPARSSTGARGGAPATAAAPAKPSPAASPSARASATDREVLSVRGLLLGATKARESADEAMSEAVARARAAGLSWDAIGAATKTQGETVRRRHS